MILHHSLSLVEARWCGARPCLVPH